MMECAQYESFATEVVTTDDVDAILNSCHAVDRPHSFLQLLFEVEGRQTTCQDQPAGPLLYADRVRSSTKKRMMFDNPPRIGFDAIVSVGLGRVGGRRAVT